MQVQDGIVIAVLLRLMRRDRRAQEVRRVPPRLQHVVSGGGKHGGILELEMQMRSGLGARPFRAGIAAGAALREAERSTDLSDPLAGFDLLAIRHVDLAEMGVERRARSRGVFNHHHVPHAVCLVGMRRIVQSVRSHHPSGGSHDERAGGCRDVECGVMSLSGPVVKLRIILQRDITARRRNGPDEHQARDRFLHGPARTGEQQQERWQDAPRQTTASTHSRRFTSLRNAGPALA